MTLKDRVGRGREVHFVRYHEGELWYRTDDGFEFPVPVADAGTGVFLAKDKAILFMRYVRKHMEALDGARAEANSLHHFAECKRLVRELEEWKKRGEWEGERAEAARSELTSHRVQLTREQDIELGDMQLALVCSPADTSSGSIHRPDPNWGRQ